MRRRPGSGTGKPSPIAATARYPFCQPSPPCLEKSAGLGQSPRLCIGILNRGNRKPCPPLQMSGWLGDGRYVAIPREHKAAIGSCPARGGPVELRVAELADEGQL